MCSTFLRHSALLTPRSEELLHKHLNIVFERIKAAVKSINITTERKYRINEKLNTVVLDDLNNVTRNIESSHQALDTIAPSIKYSVQNQDKNLRLSAILHELGYSRDQPCSIARLSH